MIPYGRQAVSDADIDAVVRVLKSDWLTQGPTIPQLESAIADKVGVHHAIAVNSATSALHIACMALGLGPGDWLWTVPNTFVASANCALYCGAKVDFVDIDPRTYNLSTAALAAKLIVAEQAGVLPKIVVPVHFAGQSCDMSGIRALAQRYGFKIVEDASHAIGGCYLSAPIGGCAYSDITVFSLHPVKIITSAEGGVALTNDRQLARRMQRLRSHGITREQDEMQQPAEGPWYYEQIELGLNYRMTDVHAALGLSQLNRLEEFVGQRRELARLYDEELADLPLIRPFQHPDTQSAFHLYVVQVDRERARLDRAALFRRLRAAGIGVNVHYIPVHFQPYYRRLGFRPGQFPESELYYSRAITLPMFATLGTEGVALVVEALRQALAAEGHSQ